MGGSSEYVSQWASGTTGSECIQAGPMPATNGVIPTLVIAETTISCELDARKYKGVVFYGYDPVAWCCLARDEIDAFKKWGATVFPTVQIVTLTDPDPSINCPPPNPQSKESPSPAELRDELRKALQVMAKRWFVEATPTDVTKLVA
jgi:hypothetical protein